MSMQPIGPSSVASTGAPERSAESAPVAPPSRPRAAEPAPDNAPEPSPAQVRQAVDTINKSMQERSQDLEFSIDEDSRRTIVKVVDQRTKEVIRQIPTVEALEISKALDSAQGLLIKQTA